MPRRIFHRTTRSRATRSSPSTLHPLGPDVNPLYSIPHPTGSGRHLARLIAGMVLAGVTLTAGPTAFAAGASAKFGQVPLFFERNEGQTDARYSYFSRGLGHAVYLAPTEAFVVLANESAAGNVARGEPRRAAMESSPTSRSVRFSLIAANGAAAGRGVSPLTGRVSHLTGERSQWQMDVPVHARVRFDGVYPGIDVVYYGNQQQLEYDFVVAPGANPGLIGFEIEGADRSEIEANGDLLVRAGERVLRQARPVAYQTIDGRRHGVDAWFKLSAGQALTKVLTIVLGDYDRNHALIIDPVLTLDYSTYLGGPNLDRVSAIAADRDGNVYIAGDTLAPLKNIPAVGSQTNFSGGSKYGGDAFVAKLDPTGTNFVYFNYLGGSALDVANALALDATGAVYVAGFTSSTNFPVFPAPRVVQPVNASAYDPDFVTHFADAFVTKIDPDGRLVYSTYLGGELDDVAAGIAVDASGQAFVTGFTESIQLSHATYLTQTSTCTNFGLTNLICGPLSAASITNILNERLPSSAFSVTNLVRREVIGATAETRTTNEILSVSYWVLVGAERLSLGFPTLNAVQTNNAGGTKRVAVLFPDRTLKEVFTTGADMFVAKLSADGETLLYSSYLGGALSRDFATGIGVDAAGNAVVSGLADEADFPVTNALQATFAGGRDGVLARFDPSGRLIYSTYLGGAGTDVAYGLAVDAAGNAYVAGSTASRDFLSTPGGVRPGGIAKSTDAGSTWAASSSGLTHTGIRTLAVHPVLPTTIYAGTPRGVFVTTDAAATWTPTGESAAGQEITALAIDSLAPSTLYAAGPGGFQRSDDAGATWVRLGAGLPLSAVSSLLIDQRSADVIHAGTRSGYYFSTNRGTNFVRAGTGLKSRAVYSLVLPSANPTFFYAGTDGGVFQSTNSGTNWSAVNAGLATRRVLALAASPSNASNLIAGTARGVYRTVDAGASWTIQTNGLGKPQINAVTYDPTDGAIVYAAATNGVYRSVDGGQNWVSATNGLPARDIVALALHPANPSAIYAGARGTNFSGGTNDAFLLKISPDGQELVYGFTFGGTRTDEARAVAVGADGSAFVTGLTMSKNFPVVGPVPGSRPMGTNSGRADVFVAQFHPSGASNVFSVHLGGKGNDTGAAIALDGQGGVYVAGYTSSKNYVTTNAFQAVRKGEKDDAFVTKLTVEEPVGTPPVNGGFNGVQVRRGPNAWLPFPPVRQAPAGR